ncbi:hypothetical protein HG535_0F01080 [Zygotorulaspora mrakii]|uniref:E3 ubiquitin-protein ligase PEP5 n=1 Tax=Zygotorulaspora mrakii TaxID=42260 RepID=A0A7H9B4I7_ZYGMR|nr:uncharacterized protein HG535_0F01080 [Zygotorulaspora mrakii]QLG73598.1 hypothetical protein HG535_0F01080 [Zygotorulaspora mrakii]
MSVSSWKQFQFYESTPIRDPLLGSDTPLYADPTLSAAAPIASSRLALAIRSNVLRVVNLSKTEIEHEFVAFEQGFQITYLKVIGNNFLVAVGEQIGKPALIRIFKLEKLPNNESSYHAQVEVKNGNNTYPISVMSVNKDLSCIAIGFVNGRILLIRGDLSRDRGSRQRLIYEDSGREPITALFLNKEATNCFAATTSSILLFNTTGRNSGQPDIILNSQQGIDLNCSCYSDFTGEYICSLKDCMHFYNEMGESHSLLFDLSNVKKLYSVDPDHILLVVEAEQAQSSVLAVEEFTHSKANRVIIIDTKNKIISLNILISHAIIDIFSVVETNNTRATYLLTSEVLICKITEKPPQEQLDIVLQKEMFPFALDLAAQTSLSAFKVQEIHKQYGDWFYKKGQKSEAVNEYIQCLDVVETSEIISKFGVNETPDPDGLKNLSDYLWSLVKSGISNSDHITLLLIALIKLRAEDEIIYFMNHYSRSGHYSKEPITKDVDDESYFYSDGSLFDLELVVRLLQESNFEKLASNIASKYAKDATIIVEILLQSLNDPHSALKYIKSLSIDETLRVLVAFSKKLLEALPNDTNLLLIEVFTGKYKQKSYNLKPKQSETQSHSHEFLDDAKKVFYSYKTFLNYINDTMINTAFEQDSLTDNASPTYHPPKPSLIFTSFLSKPFEFVVFLEACLESYQQYEGSKEDKQEILTTLYDLYLSLANDDVQERQKDWKSRAKKVLKESNSLVMTNEAATTRSGVPSKPVDNSLMMLISHMNEMGIYSVATSTENENSSSTLDSGNRANLVNTFRSLTFTDQTAECLQFLEKYEEQEPQLYRVALTYFVSSRRLLKAIGGEQVLKEKILNKILEKNLMPILDILQVLGSTNVVTYGLIKDMLISHVKEEEEEITKSEKLIKSYELELQTKKEKLKKLLNFDEPTQIKVKNSKCLVCNTSVELPLIYFKCGHIYHVRCLNEEDKLENGERLFKCPKCVVEVEMSERLFHAQKAVGSKADLLQMALNDEDDSSNRFKVVTEFIGRGGLEYSHITLEK